MSSFVTTVGGGKTVADRIITHDITVLAGGPGVEREVSLQSGRMVAEALERLGHRVSCRDIHPDDLTALLLPADMIFVALHGEFGEDGTIQRICEQRGLAYCGSDAAASALAMDKVRTKATFIENGIATPRFDLIKPARIKRAIANLTPPLVVKPRASGSSVDTHIVRHLARLEEVVSRVIERYGAALVEEYIDGPELTVGVLDGVALPVCQIRTQREFYNYQAKYLDDDTEYLFDLDFPAELLQRVQRESERAHRAIGCRDFSRVDWMVDGRTLEPYAIEVNTIPGLTSHSLLPKAAARAGIAFDELCQRVVDRTIGRAQQ